MGILTVDWQSPEAHKNLALSLKETGFVVIGNHGIPASLFQNVKEVWEKYFASDAKYDYMFDKNAFPQDGYIPTEQAKGHAFKDLKEFYHVYWNGRIPESMREVTLDLYQRLCQLGIGLIAGLEEQTPEDIKRKFSCPLTEMLDPYGQTLFRVIHYPPMLGEEPQGALRAAAHEDINLITLLPASDEPGLEAKDIHGNWHTVPCDPGMIVVNAGDFLQLCSGYYYKSTTHRVKNPDNDRKHCSRYSFPLFLHAKKHVVLDITTGFTAEDYLLERLRELGLK